MTLSNQPETSFHLWLNTDSEFHDVKAVKGVKFSYQPTAQTRELLSIFRDMVNDAIRICLAETIKGRLKLRDRIYKELQERYRIVSCIPCSVAEVAWSIVKKHKRWQRKP